MSKNIQFLTDKEVSILLGVSLDVLRFQRNKLIGIPFYKFGKQVRYSQSDVEQYIQKNKVSVNDSGKEYLND